MRSEKRWRAAHSWKGALLGFLAPPVLRMLFLGFSAGLPYLLIFGTLSIWLTEAGINRAQVTMLSWAALAFSFKFIWAPLVDRMRLPVLTRVLGRRRGWLLLSQICLCAALAATGLSDPLSSLTLTALGAVAIAFAAATQDIVIDAYRIEAAEPDLQSMMAATYQAGYRIGMLTSGAGALWLAAALGPGEGYHPEAWSLTYLAMAGLVGVGVVTTLLIPEPMVDPDREALRQSRSNRLEDHLRLLMLVTVGAATFIAAFVLLGDLRSHMAAAETLGPLIADAGPALGALLEALRLLASAGAALAIMFVMMGVGLVSRAHVAETYFEPVTDFFVRYGRVALLILLLIGTYRIADIVMGAISNVFYTEMTFDKTQIAFYTKVWGMAATLIGGFVGGIIALRWGVMKAMFLGATLVSVTNLLFAVLSNHPGDTFYLAVAITGDNFAGGLAGAAFIAYLSALTSVKFTAMQYALFSSLMTLGPKVLAGYSGGVVTTIGYEAFFIGCALIGLPVVLLVWLAARYAPPKPAD